MEVYMQMKDLNLEGNIVDKGWIENLKYDNGKTNANAVSILSEIVYWYRPVVVRDEVTGEVKGYRKKYKSDKLQKSYEALGKTFGISKDQARLACNFLVKNKIITIEFRTIISSDNRVLNNVMFIEPIFENLEKITGTSEKIEKINEKHIASNLNNNNNTVNEYTPPLQIESDTPYYYNNTPSLNRFRQSLKIDMETNTKNTTENTRKITSNNNNTNIELENNVIIEKTYTKEDLKNLQEKINNITNGNINYRKLVSMCKVKGIEKIEYYINNYDKFKSSKHNSVGYFIKAVEEEYTLPVEYKTEYSTTNNQKPIQSTNFEQRVYDDDFFNGLYDNFRNPETGEMEYPHAL